MLALSWGRGWRASERAMADMKIRYYRVKHGRGYFEPTPTMQRAGFEPRSLGKDGPEAWVEAHRLYEDWQRVRKGLPAVHDRKVWPEGSIGYAFDRYRRTEAWQAKAEATRKKDWEWSWRFIEPIFGDVAPSTVQVEDIEQLYSHVKATKGLHTAHRMIKVWRALWQVMAAMQYCEKDADPSKILRNSAPRGRKETYTAGEVARFGKAAWRLGYRGLAAILAVAWDTQFSPIDVRSLKASQRQRDARGAIFVSSRGKTGQEIVGTLTRRSERILDAYLESMGASPMGDAPIFRNRSGQPYTGDTLGDDFRDVRELAFPGDRRVLLDIRRSGAVEALAGEADPAAMAAKMGNTIHQNRQLAETYLPRKAATVRIVDEARKRGRQRLRDNEN